MAGLVAEHGVAAGLERRPQNRLGAGLHVLHTGKLGQLVFNRLPLGVVAGRRLDRAVSRRDQKLVHLIGRGVLDLELHRARFD
jgi:hypothetical protein